MSKKLRFKDPIKIAPDIVGWLDDDYNPIVIDERNNQSLDPTNLDHKLIIYERQVKDWFLFPASELVKIENRGFIVLMICLSYLEGVEQYRRGESSKNKSKEFFVSALERIYLGKFSDYELKSLYDEAEMVYFITEWLRVRLLLIMILNKVFSFKAQWKLK